MLSVFATKTRLYAAIIISFVLASAVMIVAPKVSAAPCTNPSTDYGVATMTINVPSTATYRIWTRMATDNATDNSYLLEVDGNTCFTVGDGSFNVNTWNSNSTNWVDYQNGSTTSKIDMNLTAGSHTFEMIGNAANVRIDRIVLTSDTSCVPTGTGDNCSNPPDTWNPTVSITSPAAGSTQNGNMTVTANAVDDTGGSGIQRVDFYIDDVLAGTDTSSPYQYTVDTSTLAVGNRVLRARAYDVAGNNTNSSTVTVNVQRPVDSVAPTVSITSPANGSTQTGTFTLSANATDNVGVTRVEFFVDGVLQQTDTSSPFSVSINAATLATGNRALTARAYDLAGNQTTSSAVTINVPSTPPPDTTPPTVNLTSPTSAQVISGTHSMTATASDTGGSGVQRVEFYVDGVEVSEDTSSPFSYALNTTALSQGNHTFRARAYDVAGNSTWSSNITASVNNIVIISEDINQDGRVNLQDFSLLVAAYGGQGAGLGRADINGDSRVNILDFSLLVSRYGFGT